MRTLLVDAARALVPPKGDRHGPLPPLLLALTVLTGLVDAVSFLGLGHVFVANMTGNVVFLGFALAGAQGHSVLASGVSLAAFVTGAAAGGRFGGRLAAHRGRLIAGAMTVQAALFAAALVVSVVVGSLEGRPARFLVIVPLALAMGLQNSVARRLGVPDETTTVVNQTLTGLVADTAQVGGAAHRRGRRALSVIALCLGGLTGGLLLFGSGIPLVLGVGLGLLATAAAVLWRLSTPDAVWATAP
ncbi:YoaK family protein [Streptomyces fradiae]|uniref:YoaK family protein n=1 Tax=Streptomyces fradiae TaxID=1906 RepID=UPI003517CAF2